VTSLAHETGLRFFGAMTASISHEIKNCLAIINEQAGLLNDMVQQAEKGRELDQARLGRLAHSVKNQIVRTDAIIRTMNRFAHSVDDLWQPADLCDLLPLAASLFRRMAERRSIQIQTELPQSALTVNTSPFFLLSLIWLCLDRTMVNGAEPQTLILGAAKTADAIHVFITSAGGAVAAANDGLFSSGDCESLVKKLNASLFREDAGRRIVIGIPTTR